VRAPVRPDFGADTSAFGARHARAERSDRGVVGQVVDVQRDAVVADRVAAIDQHVAATVAADVASGNPACINIMLESIAAPVVRRTA
jgi:hypothetical protein